MGNRFQAEEPETAILSPWRLGNFIRLFIAVSAILAVASFSPADEAVLSGGALRPLHNWIGEAGAIFSGWLFRYTGLATYLALALIFLRTLRCFAPVPGNAGRSFLGGVLVVFGATLLLGLTPETFVSITEKLGLGRTVRAPLALSGGVIGQVLAAPQAVEFNCPDGFLRHFIGAVGIMVAGWIMVTAGVVMIYLADWHVIVRYCCTAGLRDHRGRRDEDDLQEWAQNAEEPEEPENSVSTDSDQEPVSGFGNGGFNLLNFFGFGRKTKGAAQRSQSEDDEVLKYFGESAAVQPSTLPQDDNCPPRLKRTARVLAEQGNLCPETEEAPEVSASANLNAELPPLPERPVAVAEAEMQPNYAAERNSGSPRTTAAVPIAPAPSAATEVSTKPLVTGDHSIKASPFAGYELPSVKMLAQGSNDTSEDLEFVQRSKEILQRTLESFDIAGHVTGHISGPRVTRFEITLDPGVSVKRVEQNAQNIAMDLAAESVRILAPIPGRSAVGVEIPNRKAEAVFMRTILESEVWRSGKAEIPIALGKNVAGQPVVVDLAKAPHLLIAGATGTGKSVCTNTLIMSLLFRFSPDELKLIMVDPKIVEYKAFERLPHLLTPVLNDSSKVPVALRWATVEMDRRYQQLAAAGVKKLSEYNSRPRTAEVILDQDGKPIPDTLPALVIIIDELADLMLTEAARDIENSISRITAKGRAAGIHLILATQRPDVKVITGKIKANLPTRFCFQVRSMQDSRVMLDANGAERLLGKGDMLYMSPSSLNLERVQGAFIPDDDIHNVVNFVCNQGKPVFDDSVLWEPEEDDEDAGDNMPRSNSNGGFGNRDNSGVFDPELEEDQKLDPYGPIVARYTRPGDDPNVEKALRILLEDRQISTSYLQRKLGIGYNQAAKITDLFEERHIIGPSSNSGKKREIYIFDDMDLNEQNELNNH